MQDALCSILVPFVCCVCDRVDARERIELHKCFFSALSCLVLARSERRLHLVMHAFLFTSNKKRTLLDHDLLFLINYFVAPSVTFSIPVILVF